MTRELFREDSYLAKCEATISTITNEGVETDQSVFYPLGGGQLGDTGYLTTSDGKQIAISNSFKEKETGRQIHCVDATNSLHVGDTITLELDWSRRYRMMRFHSCLHMLCALIDAPVTGGSIQVDRARLDFDLKEPIDKDSLNVSLQELILRDAQMTTRWISDAELDAQPELVRTMSVKPPRNAQGTIRLVEFEGIDLQPCGGTHVASTKEIGTVKVQKIEKKGKQNRRIIIVFDE